MSEKERRRTERSRNHQFAPVLRDEDEPIASDEDRTKGREVSGTGVPGARKDLPDALPPTPEGVGEAERLDDTGDDGWSAGPGRPRPPEDDGAER